MRPFNGWAALSWADRWRLFKSYIPGTWGWGARRYLKREGQWPK